MFKPLVMQYISLQILTEDAPLAAQLLAECGVFNPETTELMAETLPEQPAETFRQVFQSARSRLDKILARIDFTPAVTTPLEGPITFKELVAANDQLGQLWFQFSQLEDQLHQFNEQRTQLKKLLETLQKFHPLDFELKIFQEPRQFLNLHIGTIPRENVTHLQEAVALAAHFIDIFHHDNYSTYVVIAGPLEYQEQVDSVLKHADFQPITIPAQFHSHPQQVHADLTAQLTQLQAQVADITTQIQTLANQQQPFLAQAYHTLNQAAAYAQLAETLRGRGQLALIEGWIPEVDLPRLKITFARQFEHPLVLTHRRPTLTEYWQVPSLLRHHPWLTPFVALVNNYGIPRYGEFDPTLLFTVTFIFMFGTMFGDVGHGALIAGAGWYWRDKLKTFTPFLLAAGSSSMFFGLLYGSVFGFEEVLFPALWLSPIHHPILMLTLALYWGIGFILLATAITIVNAWQAGHYSAALFNHTGVAGMVFYVGGLDAVHQWMMTQTIDNGQRAAMLLPLLVILGYKWHENKLPLVERLLVTVVEGFESALNYLSNTLSFLRVAAFSLNHAALAIAVFTLADLLGTPTNWLAIVLGNLFIVILEGAIVTIQVLRLEYYEGFSRFFSGDGRAFSPLVNGIH